MNCSDNIAAPATAVGGAITVIRISGPDALAIANTVWHGKTPLAEKDARRMRLGKVGADPALAVLMKAPFSYTGDNVVELHCHGGAAAAGNALNLLFRAGCRMAEPGEFTFRAFINGKLDLTQAEAVSEVIAASGELAFRSAEKQLAGELSQTIRTLRDELVDLRAECESHLDFPEEELDWAPDVPERIGKVMKKLQTLSGTAVMGCMMREGVPVALAGRPNAGKSSLLNALLGYERAIVSQIPGTTRDTLEECAALGGIPVRLTDTAGMRETMDPVEKMGVERSHRSIASAAVTFWLLDASAKTPEQELTAMRKAAPKHPIAVWNKIDLVPDRQLPETGVPTVKISAKTGEGLDLLAELFRQQITGSADLTEPQIAVSSRHRECLERALDALSPAMEKVQSNEFELASLQLRQAIGELEAITGENVSPDILDNIFSRFCIGK